jgi:hypothetical protein
VLDEKLLQLDEFAPRSIIVVELEHLRAIHVDASVQRVVGGGCPTLVCD